MTTSPRRPGQRWLPVLLAITCAPMARAATWQATGPPLPFSARAELPTSGKPVGVMLHDFDGDGRARLVAATLDPGTLHLWTDPLLPPLVIPIPDYPLGPQLLRLATVDAVVVVSRESQEMLVFAPTAEDPAKPLHRVALGARPHAFGCGPLVATETPSVVVATLSNELVVIDHRGTSRFPLLDGLPTFVAVEPGRVIVGSQSERSARAYSLQPDGSLLADERPLELGGIPRGYLRVQTETASESWIVGGEHALWRTTGFADHAPRLLGTQRLGAVPFEIQVLGGAGADPSELASLSIRNLSYSILKDGRERHAGRTGQDPWGMASGDMDGDGYFDLAIANRGARRVSLILGRKNRTFHEALNVPVGRGPHSLASGDLDGDGLDEILVIDAMDQELVVLSTGASDGKGPEGERRMTAVGRYPAAPAGDALACADVDGDGHLDVGFLLRTSEGARLRILFGDGQGALAARDDFPDLACGRSVGDLWLGDLDGDGRADGLIADPAGGAVIFLRGTPDGLVHEHTLALATSPSALCVSGSQVFVGLGDPGPRVGLAELELIQRAGKLLLAERNYIEMGLSIADIALIPNPTRPGIELALLSKPAAGDGTGWVVVARESFGLWSQQDRVRTGLRPFAITAGDFDGDGLTEVFVGAQNSHHVNAWRMHVDGLVRLPDIGTGRGILDVLLVNIDPGEGATLAVANGFSNDVGLVRSR